MRSRLIVFFACISFFAAAQTDTVTSTGDPIDFLLYMAGNHQVDDCNFYGDQLLSDSTINSDYRDSLAFVLGELNKREKRPATAYQYFMRVSGASFFYYKSRFSCAMIDFDNKKYDTALYILKNTEVDSASTVVSELKDFELAGLALLKKDYQTYDSLASNFNSENEMLNSEQNILKKSAYQLKSVKRKSPLVAGLLSTAVPGLGKVYAGRPGQALAAFLRVVPIGAIAYENYLHGGIKDPQFIVFASLFSLFYVGNIWGSVLSVQLTRDEKINEIHYNIGVGLHVPIDSLFE